MMNKLTCSPPVIRTVAFLQLVFLAATCEFTHGDFAPVQKSASKTLRAPGEMLKAWQGREER